MRDNAMSTSDQSVDKYTAGFALAFVVTAIFNALLTILKEEIPAIHDLLVSLFMHHWIGHGVVDLILFFGLGILFSKSAMVIDERKLPLLVLGATLLGAGLVVGFVFLKSNGVL